MTKKDNRRQMSTAKMGRLTVRFPAARVQMIDQLVDDDEFPTRSEAIRAAVRRYTHDRTQ